MIILTEGWETSEPEFNTEIMDCAIKGPGHELEHVLGYYTRCWRAWYDTKGNEIHPVAYTELKELPKWTIDKES